MELQTTANCSENAWPSARHLIWHGLRGVVDVVAVEDVVVNQLQSSAFGNRTEEPQGGRRRQDVADSR